MDKTMQSEIKIVAVFGEKLSKWASEYDVVPDESCAKEYGGSVKTHVFKTKEELDAYIAGVNDAYAWNDFAVFNAADARHVTLKELNHIVFNEDSTSDNE